MADENTEEKKKGGILKLLMFVGGGILLVGIGLGVGFFLLGWFSLVGVRRGRTLMFDR